MGLTGTCLQNRVTCSEALRRTDGPSMFCAFLCSDRFFIFFALAIFFCRLKIRWNIAIITWVSDLLVKSNHSSWCDDSNFAIVPTAAFVSKKHGAGDFLWVWQTFSRGCATHVRGRVECIGDFTNTPYSKPLVPSTQMSFFHKMAQLLFFLLLFLYFF